MVKGLVKIISVAYLFLITSVLQVYGQEMTITGVYQGKNLYLQNPPLSNGLSFCTIAVYLNDELVISKPSTTAFEIDLSKSELNEPIVIRILHEATCVPKVINPQVIRQKSPFRFVDILPDSAGIHWVTEGEEEIIRYFIEKRINDNWIIVSSAEAGDAGNMNQYHVKLAHSSGVNQYRIKGIISGNEYVYSGIMNYHSGEAPVSFYPERVSSKITLSRETDYEVLDVHGNLLVKGKEKEISVEDLSPGLYYLVIENRMEKFIKK